MKKLIITGDDFGISLPANEAVEEAHLRGILNCASLMVGAKATDDAVQRAKRLPTLNVGLHLVLVDGTSLLPPHEIPGLVDKEGQLSSRLVLSGIRFFCRRSVRRQLEAEIRAQFEAFQKTGLNLDHVNTHHHMHLHPTVLKLVLKAGRDYGMKALRFPYEPPWPSWHASQKGLPRKLLLRLLLFPWLALLKNRLEGARIHSNQFLFGLNDSGNMHLDLVLRFFEYLPRGVTEIYFHPVLPHIDLEKEDSDCGKEYRALTNPQLRQILLASGIQQIAFSDLGK
ncbi:MAG TPA: hopanoid biosynthesis-associated protein HpnK [Thermodesulfobacteriota bacterium]|jgi:hopanoid biosynthesis associated protein HpnK|nr:hopanoid biosynthesis-associated protein HpnK [Thermodesulfobacteriota bacterium]